MKKVIFLFLVTIVTSVHAQKIIFPHEVLDGIIDSTSYAESVNLNFLKICRSNHYQFSDSNKVLYGQQILLPDGTFYKPFPGESIWRASEYYTIMFYIRRDIKQLPTKK